MDRTTCLYQRVRTCCCHGARTYVACGATANDGVYWLALEAERPRPWSQVEVTCERHNHKSSVRAPARRGERKREPEKAILAASAQRSIARAVRSCAMDGAFGGRSRSRTRASAPAGWARPGRGQARRGHALADRDRGRTDGRTRSRSLRACSKAWTIRYVRGTTAPACGWSSGP